VEQKKPEGYEPKQWIRPLGFLLTVGLTVVLSVLIPTGIGYWLDMPERLNSRPLYTLIGFGVGTILAFAGLVIELRRFYREEKKRWGNKEKGQK
jgi:hypothetical protein